MHLDPGRGLQSLWCGGRKLALRIQETSVLVSRVFGRAPGDEADFGGPCRIVHAVSSMVIASGSCSLPCSFDRDSPSTYFRK
ncbi:hypothetical protein HispidOSU_003058 [Sigmodon hispidus]